MSHYKKLALVSAVVLLCGSHRGCRCTEEEPVPSCLQMTELLTTEVQPAGVRTIFKLQDCNGEPVADLKNEQVAILLDGEEIQSEGDVAPVLTQEVAFEQYALLLLDMSDSIVKNGRLVPMVNAAKRLVGKLVSQGVQVAVYRFAGPSYFAEVQGFTGDEAALTAALDGLTELGGLGTTDLYGSLIRAIAALGLAGSTDVLTTRTLVLFTDGSDEARTSSREDAEAAVRSTEASVFTVGLGGDVNKEEMVAFGKDGFEWAEDLEALDTAFTAITDRIRDLARSHYLVAVCTPRVGGMREMTIGVDRGDATGSLTVSYNADGFDIVGCDSSIVAFPCKDKQCGDVDGLSCGICSGTTFCNEAFTCEEACTDDIECGLVQGMDCGDCSGLGATFFCEQNLCVDACAEAECGTVLGVDCGDCSELGATFTCDAELTCVDPCAEAECGTILGVDCGDCSELGETFGCDAELTCVDACADAECGTVLGVDCGDCSELGATFGCDADHACVDACAEAECGTVLGVDCGDCSELGATFGCDANHACVDACTDIECGTVLGVDCGTCDDGFDCTAEHACVPKSIPGMTWVEVPAGVFTLGCDLTVDEDCDYDEVAHDVDLSPFWILSTEVTVAQYAACVTAKACSASQVGTGVGCNSASTPDRPANCLTYDGLKQLCAFVGGLIPTEAQWERAFRGDHDIASGSYWTYPWGDSPAPSCDRVVMNEGGPGCGTGAMSDVASRPATGFGLHDMAGNAAEWARDLYGESFPDCGGEPCVDPKGPLEGSERVVRGGSYADLYASAFRTAKRDKEDPLAMSASIGGRCVVEE